MSGFYRMHRGWMDHPALGGAREPFCRRAAWCWMIENAAWKGTRESIAGKTIQLERGQLTASLRYMAKAWGWSEAAVRRFIERLKTDAMIDAATDAGQLVITICNYSKYQAYIGTADAPADAPTDAEATQDRRKREEGKEGKEVKEDSVVVDAREATEPVPEAGTDQHTQAGTDQHDDARTVVAKFHQLRGEGWPTEAKFPAPELTLLHQASTVLADMPLATVLEVMTTETTNAVTAGKTAPQSLKAFTWAFDRARRHTTTGGPVNGYRTHTRPSDRISPDDRRRAILEA